jgi:hypothetical protein
MKKNLQVMTFMSWDNEEWANNQNNGNIRAIALCDPTGYFNEAINCMRDGSMGEKDENGVYERHWYGDDINCYGNERESLRLATKEEIDLYLQYVPIEDAVGENFCDHCKVKIVDMCFTTPCFGYVVVGYYVPLWQRIKKFFRSKRLPF